MAKKRYVQVGLGARSSMFRNALLNEFRQYGDLLAICDINLGRLELAQKKLKEQSPDMKVKTYPAEQFEQMIAECKPDVVLVTTGPDCTHSDYICRAMKLGCDVVTEKPMTTDEIRCKKILTTAAQTGKNVQVTFNYRYAPPRSQIKQMIQDGLIGKVLSVHFEWMLDTRHGADYFRRWHRHRKNSGSLLVHKSTHHFDLVNWWLADVPEEIFCQGTRKFYTPENADAMGLQGRGERCRTCPVKDQCRFFLDLEKNEFHRTAYLECEQYDGYIRDRCVFAEEINIWDNMAVNVRYQSGAILNYLLHAYSPYEGYRIAFNGTKGRLEHFACENTYISGDESVPGELEKGNVTTTFIPEFSSPQEIEVCTGTGGHGGGDPVLLTDIFDPNAPADPLNRKAHQRDGAYSILIGVAAAKSIDTKEMVRISELLGDAPLG